MAVIAVPFVLRWSRRWGSWDVCKAAGSWRRETHAVAPASMAGNLYGRGLTNAVLPILVIAVLPSAQSLLLPAFLIIIGTEIIMTVLVFREPVSEDSPPAAGGGLVDPLDPFRAAAAYASEEAQSDRAPALPSPRPTEELPESPPEPG